MQNNSYRPQPHDFINSIPSIQDFEYIGRGGFGEVYAATIKDEQGNPVRVAVKKIAFNTQDQATVQRRLTYLHRELSLLKILHSQALTENGGKYKDVYSKLTMRLYSAYVFQQEYKNRFQIYQVIEIFPSDLFKSRELIFKLGSEDLRFIMYQIVLGIDYIHHLGIVHRDVSPDNVFITWGDNGNKRVVISDFGQARFYVEYAGSKYAENFTREQDLRKRASLTNPALLGKIHYRPPEGLAYYTSEHYDTSWDIWQVGLVLLNMLCKNRHPFALEEKDYQMLTRHNRPAGDLTNDEYMLGLIETRFGHPTEQELKDLIYFGPKDVDPKNEITMRWREEKKTQYSTLLNAFLKTAKARQFHKTRTLGTETEIDTVRVKYLMKASRRTLQYIDEPCNRDFVQPAIKFIVKLLRYSPSSRPSSRQLLDDPFFKEPLDPRTPLLYSPIDTKEMPDIKAMYQDQLIRFSDEVGFQGFQNFIGTFIQPWGYIKVHDLTPGFERGNHCVPVLRMIRKLAEADQFKEFINQENAAQIIEQVLNEQLQSNQQPLRCFVYRKSNPKASGTITMQQNNEYFIISIDMFIICFMQVRPKISPEQQQTAQQMEN